MMKKLIAFGLALVLLLGLLPSAAFAATEENLWKGKSVLFVGDSITYGSKTKKIYYQYLKESMGFGSVTSNSVSGRGISANSDYGHTKDPLIDCYLDIPAADLIVVFLGTNDYGHESPLGTAEDTTDVSFYGALNVILPGMLKAYPSSKIVFVTPIHRYGFGSSKMTGVPFTHDTTPNGYNATLGDYAAVLKEACATYGVDVIDLYEEYPLDPSDATVRSKYMTDGLHPNAEGHKMMANIMEEHIRTYTPVEGEPETPEEPAEPETELVYGNKFAAGYSQTNRACSRRNFYLKAGTTITFHHTDTMQWACAKTSSETSTDRLGYFPDSAWSNKTTATVAADGWVGFAFRYRDESQVYDLTRPLSDFITIEEPHVHTYTPTVTAPTCAEQGYTTYTCPCGDAYVDDYVEVTDHHSYQNGFCTACGAASDPYLQSLPSGLTGCTNLYDALTPVKGYYTATKYDTTNGVVLSVVIPVEPGDRIAATSFGPKTEHLGSVDGIRVTYLLDGTIVQSLSADTVYATYKRDGYLTVPEGVNMVCVPWWKPTTDNGLILLRVRDNFAVHRPVAAPAQAPTCTESGYTAGEACEVCQVSLGNRTEIRAMGHTYVLNTCVTCGAIDLTAYLSGKTVSILGDSISTFNGYSNDATVNDTIGGNGHRYDAGTADTKPSSYCLLESVSDTWWMRVADQTGMQLLVNNSWAGSQVFGGKTSDGRVIPAAYLDRCVNLHDNTLANNPDGEPITPDVIFVYLGINDYNFNRSNVGSGAVDYANLVGTDGTYVTPTTFGEAYAIMLHKMLQAYPNAQIFAMTLLPTNLYAVDMAAWEQHNAYIRAAAEYYGVPLVDMAAHCAITWDNYSAYVMDRIHPTTAGMKLMADCVEASLAAYYGQNTPITFSGNSVSEDVSGLAFRFDVMAEGLVLNGTAAVYDNAMVDGYRLLSMGAVVTNGVSTTDIPAVYLCDLEPNSASFAVRIINIPADKYDVSVTATPYIVLEMDGVATTVYGQPQTCSYNAVIQ